MKKGKKQAKRRNANVTMAFGIREKIVLCFLVPVLFMIVLGIISYRKAADGMSTVSYTHLDVYKRQLINRMKMDKSTKKSNLFM